MRLSSGLGFAPPSVSRVSVTQIASQGFHGFVAWIESVGGLAAVAAHEAAVFARLLDGLTARDDVELVGSPSRRTPTVAFLKRGETPQRTAERLAQQGVCVWAGHYYALELMQLLGLPDGAVRAGVVGYTSDDDVDRLLSAL